MFNGLWRPAWLGRGRDPLRAAFGHLEREVMEVVWQGGSVSVRDVQGRLPRSVAYTTAMTTLDRLFKKGFVERTLDGRAFRYSAAHTRQQVETAVAAGLLTGFLQHGSGAVGPLLSNLVDVVAERDGALLDELAALVREKRRAAGVGGATKPKGKRR
jgi:predicted transcriptional regulator